MYRHLVHVSLRQEFAAHNSQLTKYAVAFPINSQQPTDSHKRFSLIFVETASIANLWLQLTNESSSDIKVGCYFVDLKE